MPVHARAPGHGARTAPRLSLGIKARAATAVDLSRYRRAQNTFYVSGGRKIAYALNGGGVEILASSLSGAITVRQAQ